MKPQAYQKIFGWFGFESIYDMIYNSVADGGIFVEIGAFMGKSTAYFAELIKNNPDKFVRFITIDHFKGSDEPLHYEILKGISLKQTYFNNIAQAGLSNQVSTLVMDNNTAANYFQKNSIDAVFIDGGHTYDEVLKDVTVWYDKVKDGGIVAGHDYYGSHQGVREAVDYLFDDKEIHSDRQTECWWIYKNVTNRPKNVFFKQGNTNLPLEQKVENFGLWDANSTHLIHPED